MPSSTARRWPTACWCSWSSKASPAPCWNRCCTSATEVGLPVTLAEIGLTDLPAELLHQIASRATAKGETIHNEPFEVRPDMVADAILAADAWGGPGRSAAWERTGPSKRTAPILIRRQERIANDDRSITPCSGYRKYPRRTFCYICSCYDPIAGRSTCPTRSLAAEWHGRLVTQRAIHVSPHPSWGGMQQDSSVHVLSIFPCSFSVISTTLREVGYQRAAARSGGGWGQSEG